MSEAATYSSGKTHRDENFPVASLLVARRYRPTIMAFYSFVRMADDVADDPRPSPTEKVRILDEMEAALAGTGPHADEAEPLRRALAERGLADRHVRDLLAAFRQDAVKQRYADWDELMAYCALSAMPVGRFVLDVHGEDRAVWPASDALCAALQIVNHLQDCGTDYRRLDRVYLPADLLERNGARVEDLGAAAAGPALRRALGEAIGRCRRLLVRGAAAIDRVRDRRLAVELAATHALCVQQLDHLARHDPLAGDGRPGKAASLLVALRAVAGRSLHRRTASSHVTRGSLP